MIKLRGFGGVTEYWDHNLESFTLMAGLAATTSKIKLYASTPILVLPPAIVARVASTIDSIAPGRFGVNIVTGWAPGEYAQMGLWPGDVHFGNRYRRAAEYVTVLRDLLDQGVSDFSGEFYQMNGCVLSPRPSSGAVPIIGAGRSDKGISFSAEYADYNFVLGSGINTPTAFAPAAAKLAEASKATGRNVGTLALFMVIADETEELAMDRWYDYHQNGDLEALEQLSGQSVSDLTAEAGSTARTMIL